MPELPEVETIVRTLGPQIREKHIRSAEVLLPKALQHGAERLPLLTGAKIEEISRRAKLLLISVRPKASLQVEDFASSAGKTALLAQEANVCGSQSENTGPVDADTGQKTSLETTPERAAVPMHRETASGPPVFPAGTGLLLAFHLKMTGRFFVHPPGTSPLKHTRLIFDLEDGKRLFFDDTRTFGYCRIMSPHELALWPFWAGLGPEPLGISPKELASHFLHSFTRRRCPVKNALLDQSVVAGVGNIYADESLFLAGILPTARTDSIPEPRLLNLAKALQSVLQQSIEECGSSIRDYRDALGNAGAFQNSFAVYGRKNEPCRTCGNPLQSCRLAGRATVYCPVCQSGNAF